MTAITPSATGSIAGNGNGHRAHTATEPAGSEAAPPGKSAHSTAARARQILALQTEESGTERQPFGRTVSQVARGLLSLEDIVALQGENDTGAAEGDAEPATDATTQPAATASAAGESDGDSTDPRVPASDDVLADALTGLIEDALEEPDTV